MIYFRRRRGAARHAGKNRDTTERISTPRMPVISSLEVTEILSGVAAARRRGDGEGCLELVAKIKASAKASERNRRCMVANGTGGVLSETFEAFSEGSFDQNRAVLEEILSALTLMFPLDEETKSHLASSSSLDCLVWFLKHGDLSAQRNGVLLTIIYCMVSSSVSSAYEVVRVRFTEMGMVSVLLEMLVDAEQSTCERALGVLDGLCSCDEGSEEAYRHALTMPVLVKKIRGVSDLATEFSVSVLWKLSKVEEREKGGDFFEALLEVGAFQKLLLVLQVGCGEKTKEKANKLLKMLNRHRDQRSEFIDSLDFKGLKRTF